MEGFTNFTISTEEATEIAISVIAISFALTIAMAGLGALLAPKVLLSLMALFIITVGSGFILHEMAHKFVANYYGAYATFRMWTQGIILMLVLSVTGFIFAAPGAVYIYAYNITRKQNGLISVAGPITNIALATLFLILAMVKPIFMDTVNIWLWAAKINIFLGLFNMIPIFPLDGSKVLAWNWMVWLLISGICLAGYLLILL